MKIDLTPFSLHRFKALLLRMSSITILLIGIVCFFLVKKYRWEGNNGKAHEMIISSDGVGYYSYLPNIFINKNIDNQTPDERYLLTYKNKTINKYYVGTAIAMAPFFGLGYMLADENQMKDGFSPPFQKAISLAGLFYLLLGLLFLAQLLLLYELKESLIAIVLLLITFGSNLLVYSIDSSSMSHVYSFCFVTGFLYLSKKFFLEHKNHFIYLASFFLGMVILIRPINGIILLALPFLASSLLILKNSLTKKLKQLTIGSLLMLSIILVQLFFNFLQTGDFFIWSYKNEGFYFLNPAVKEVLWGFRKGWFIYTPLAFLSFLALFSIVKENKFAYGTLLFFFIILVYITSSWWNWFYGPSFGQRPFVEFYGLTGIILAFWFSKVTSTFKRIFLGVICSLIISLNLIQSYQYSQNILSTWNMDFEKYKYTFLKTDKKYINRLGGTKDILLYNSNPKKELSQTLNFDDSDQNGIFDFTSKQFGASFKIPITEHLLSDRGLFAEISLDRKEIDLNSCGKALVVVHLKNKNKETYHYSRFKINEVPDNPKEWKTYHYQLLIPPIQRMDDIFSIYIWNKEKKAFYLDNFSLNLYSIH